MTTAAFTGARTEVAGALADQLGDACQDNVASAVAAAMSVVEDTGHDVSVQIAVSQHQLEIRIAPARDDPEDSNVADVTEVLTGSDAPQQ